MAPAGAKAKAEARAEATAIRQQNEAKYVRTYERNYSNALIWPKPRPRPKLGKASLFELTYEMAKSKTYVVTLTDASPQECSS